ncbi:MAG TPA: redoxin domain-containing protein, partial [Leptolyngbyaceae cyanobacterium M33_DOE_097]|nr:redoxin domain-containing protein [Leptolyngbyaceae cyanobacterium M33_DOE_097]
MLFRRCLNTLFVGLLALILVALPGAPANTLGGPQPPLNELAPQFTLPTNTGDGSISLTDYRGQWVVVYFYPKDFTPGCTVEARKFQEDLSKYIERNTQVLGISISNSQYENNSHKNIHFEQLSMAGIPILPFIKLSAQAFRGSDFSTNVS